MNHAQRKSLVSKVGMHVTALNPQSEQWEQGQVTGTYHRERIGDFDIGLTIDFGSGNPVEVNQKHVIEPSDRDVHITYLPEVDRYVICQDDTGEIINSYKSEADAYFDYASLRNGEVNIDAIRNG